MLLAEPAVVMSKPLTLSPALEDFNWTLAMAPVPAVVVPSITTVWLAMAASGPLL